MASEEEPPEKKPRIHVASGAKFGQSGWSDDEDEPEGGQSARRGARLYGCNFRICLKF